MRLFCVATRHNTSCGNTVFAMGTELVPGLYFSYCIVCFTDACVFVHASVITLELQTSSEHISKITLLLYILFIQNRGYPGIEICSAYKNNGTHLKPTVCMF